MTKSKRNFLIAVIIFVIILGLIGYDFSRKSVAPWQKDKVEEVEK